MKKVLLDRVQNMSVSELYEGIYTDPLTGLLNRRAFEEDHRPFVVLIDLDSLKYVNDTLGHDRGNRQLCAMARHLVDAFGGDSVYRIGGHCGDEFAIKADTTGSLVFRLRALRNHFPGFSYGAGTDIELADRMLQGDKALRLRNGQRAPRGEQPPWL